MVRELCGWVPPKQKCKFDIIEEGEMNGLNDCVDDMNDAIGGQEIGLLDKGWAVQVGRHFDDTIFEDLGGDHLGARGLMHVPRNPTRV